MKNSFVYVYYVGSCIKGSRGRESERKRQLTSTIHSWPDIITSCVF